MSAGTRAREPLGVLPIGFAIVGVQKAATSMMDLLLGYHEQVSPFRVAVEEQPSWYGSNKELHFFDDESLDWEHPDYTGYARIKTQETQIVAGDSTPSYLFWPRALERMHAYNPDMRLVASFRDPVERFFSQWTMGQARPRPFPSFSECLEQYGDASLMWEVPPHTRRWEPHRRSMVARGLYGAQLERGLGVFDRDQWLLVSFDDYVADYRAVLDRLAAHVGIHPYNHVPKLPHVPTPPITSGHPPPTAEELRRLADRYAEDLVLFESLSGIDVSGWSTRRIVEGSMAAEELAERFARKFASGHDDADD